MLPVMMVVVICVLTLIAIMSGRSNEPDVAGDDNYPHQVCTFDNYCAGAVCTRDRISFVLYRSYVDGQPHVELAGMSPDATFSEANGAQVFTTTGAGVTGRFEIFRNRDIDFVGSINNGEEVVEHFATGECERPHTP